MSVQSAEEPLNQMPLVTVFAEGTSYIHGGLFEDFGGKVNDLPGWK